MFYTSVCVKENNMGNSLENLSEGEVDVLPNEVENFYEEKAEQQIKQKQKFEEKADRILDEMEESYLKLEKILKVFNRM